MKGVGLGAGHGARRIGRGPADRGNGGGGAQGRRPPWTGGLFPCIFPPTLIWQEMAMAWTRPKLREICVGMEINGYLPAAM
ncbi:MAG: pyrroloquinoline quinone precursor peptide PqqA [Rhodospirillales bacterium]|nr:pyrroloquinoline quinone precursor peptide PqqA [Rhodospirillales bacterium]